MLHRLRDRHLFYYPGHLGALERFVLFHGYFALLQHHFRPIVLDFISHRHRNALTALIVIRRLSIVLALLFREVFHVVVVVVLLFGASATRPTPHAVLCYVPLLPAATALALQWRFI